MAITLTFPLSSYANGAETELVIVVPDDYVTIQSAIDIASDGDVIFVKQGTYTERLRIYKSVTILGSGASSTVIESPGGGHTVELSKGANNVIFAGFTVKGKKTKPWSGIYVRSLYNFIRDNVVVNHEIGIQLYDSSSNVLRRNQMYNNTYNLRVWGLSLSHFLHDIDSSNLVNEKPVYYWINQQGKTVPFDAGYVAIVNSTDIIVKDLVLSDNLSGVLLAHSSNITVTNVTASMNERGLYIIYSHNNTVANNNFSGNTWSGITTISSKNNFIIGNTLNYNVWNGIRLSHSFPLLPLHSENNVIGGNTVTGNKHGIYLEASKDNRITGNMITGSAKNGIIMYESNGNVLSKNTLMNNGHGVRLYESNNNFFYNNNLVNNSVQVGVSFSANVWDDGFLGQGNYWSNYAGTDDLGGPNQDQPGSDGIGDSPYVIDEDNQDQYPLIRHYVLLSGDFNDDGTIDIADIAIVAISFGSYPGHPRWNPQADLNRDSKIDIGDLALVAINFGKARS